MVEGHPLMTWPDAFSFGQDDSDCSTAPPVGWSYLLVPKLSSVGGLVYLKGWRRRKSKSLVYERQPTRFNHKQTGFHNHKLPGGSRCGTEFLKPKSNADLDSIAVSLFGWSKQIQFKSSPNRETAMLSMAEWLCLQPHSVMLTTSWDNRKRAGHESNKKQKNETIMNQRIISAERALFLSSSSGSWSISQPINQSCRRGCFCVTVGVTWQPVPFSVTSRIAIRGGRWSKETEFENLLSTLPSTCQWSPSS